MFFDEFSGDWARTIEDAEHGWVQAIPYWLRVHFAYIWSDSTEGACTLHRREYYGLVFQPGHRAIHATHRAGNRRCSGTRSFASLFAS